MKSIIKLFVLFFAVSYSVFAEIDTYSTYRILEKVEKPMFMHYDSNQDMMHIFGITDSKSTWRMEKIINNTFTGSERYELENIKLPFKPGFDNENGFVYIPFEGQIKRYNLYGDVNEQEIANIDADAIDVAGTHLLLATNHNEGERGELQVFNIASGSVLQRVSAGYNLKDVKHYFTEDGNIGIALLSDGDMEGTSSVIHFGPIVHMGSFTLDSVIIENNATEIRIKDSLLVATGGETDGIHLLNLNSGELTQHFLSLGSYNPASSVIAGNGIYTATTYGDIRKTDLFSGDMKHIISSSLDNFDYIEAYGEEWLYAADTENNTIQIFQKTIIKPEELYEDFEVGLEPFNVFFYENNFKIHALCNGYDANFNGEYEEEMGDEKPSWWSIEISIPTGINYPSNEKATKIMDFEFGSIGFPYTNNDIALVNDIMHIPLNDEIKAYSINQFDNYAEQFSSEIPVRAASITYVNQYLTVAERVDEGNDIVKLFNPTADQPFLTVEAEENVAEAFSFEFNNGNRGLIIGNIGSFTEPNSSTIQWAEYINGEEPQLMSYPVGDVLNDMDMSENLIAFTLNGSHQVKLIDINEGPENIISFNTGTNGWNGPRDVAVYNNDENKYLFVSTYVGDIRKIDITHGLMTEIIPTLSKAEGIDLSSDRFGTKDNPAIIVANISKSDYSSNNKVSAMFINIASVNEFKGKTVSKIKLYPNPSVDYVNIETDKILPGNSDIEIYNMAGELLLSETINSVGNTQLNFSSYNLSSGYYLMRIVNNGEIYTAPLEIQK